MNTVLFKLSLYRHLRLTKMNFCSTIPEAGFFQYWGRRPAILNFICKIFQFLCSYGGALPILKQSWKVLEYSNKQYSYVPLKFVCIKILPKYCAGDFICMCHIATIFEYNSVILLLGFTTSEMLHRCTTEVFLLQYFFNLILKGNSIVVCFCLMSNALANVIFKTGGQYYSFTFV